MTPDEKIKLGIAEHVDVIQRSFSGQAQTLHALAKKVAGAFHQDGRLWLLGAAPLASVAHLVSMVFLNRLNLERPPLPGYAIRQDADLAGVLEREGKGHQAIARQLQVLGRSGDLLLLFGASGSDPAVEEAIENARQMQLVTAAIFPEGSQLSATDLDFSFVLETRSMARAVEASLLFGHLLCELVEREIFGV